MKGFKKILFNLYIYFKLKRPFRKYQIVEVTDPKILDDIYRFRYKQYCQNEQLLAKEQYPDEIEFDEYDKYSIHFVVYNRRKEIIGTLRLIKNSGLSFPTIGEFNLESKLVGIDKGGIIEVSRFVVEENYRKTMLMVDLCKTVYLYAVEHNYSFFLGCAELWFIKSLNYLFGPLNIIADSKFCFNAMNYPFLLGVKEAQRNASNISSILLRYFNDKTKVIFFS